MLRKSFIPFYFIATIHLIGECFYWPVITWTKPFLMPGLALGLFLSLRNPDRKISFIKTAFAALGFSTVGDILLQFEKPMNQPMYFYFGLGAFLMAQGMYIITFRRIGAIPISKKWFMLYLMYFFLFLALLYPGMGLALKIPVTLYGLILTLMAWNSWRTVTIFPKGFIAVIGALLFVASDSILAINKFKTPVPNTGIWIMLTYILAQYFIIDGVRSRVE